MFEVEVTVPLRFRHSLEGFGERFSKPHSHTWDVTVVSGAKEVDNRGVSVDFVELKQTLAGLLEPFQGQLLNSHEPFTETQPTAENIARLVAELLGKSYPGLVHSVTVGSGEERARFTPG